MSATHPAGRMSAARLLAINGCIRMAGATSGQFFAFLLADALTGRAGFGSGIVGLVGAAYFAAELLGAPFAGRWADARGQQRILRLVPMFGVAAAVAGALAAQAAVFPLLMALVLGARLSEGASAACAVPTTLALLSHLTEAAPRGRFRIMGLFEITSLMGMILGFAIGGVSWDRFGPLAFLLLVPLYVVVFILIPGEDRVTAPALGHTVPVLTTLRAVVRRPGAIPFGVAWLAVNAVVGLWVQHSPYLFKLESPSPQLLVGGFSGRTIGVIYLLWGVTFLIGMGLWALLGAHLRRRRTMAIALAGMCLVAGSLALLNHGSPRWTLGLVVIGILIESGFPPAAFSHLADLTDSLKSSRAATMGLYSMVLGSGQLLGSLIGAPFAARWQMDGVLLLTALLAAVALGGIAMMQRSRAASG